MMQNRVLARLGRLVQQQQQGCGGAAADAAAAAWSGAGAAPATAWPSQQRPSVCLLGPEQQQQQQRRQKHTVPVVLLKDHPKLGDAGKLVRVKAGYARHSLFPDGVADYAVPGVLRRMREEGFLQEDSDAAGPGRRRRGLPGGGAAAGGQLEGRGSSGDETGELPEIVKLLTSRAVVARRRYRWKTEDQSMVGDVTAAAVSDLVRRQLHVRLPAELVMLDSPITDFGEFSVPLNLVGPDGRQVEVKVNVIKVRHT